MLLSKLRTERGQPCPHKFGLDRAIRGQGCPRSVPQNRIARLFHHSISPTLRYPHSGTKRARQSLNEIGAPEKSGLVATTVASPDAPERDLESGTWTERKASLNLFYTLNGGGTKEKLFTICSPVRDA